MESYAHPIAQIGFHTALKSGLLIRQLIVRIKAILQKEDEEEEGIQDDD